MRFNILFYLILSVLLLDLPLLVLAVNDSTAKPAAENNVPATRQFKPADVAPFGSKLYTIYTGIGQFTPAQRARLNENKIRSIAESPFYHTDSINIFRGELAWAVMYGESIITSVFDDDARAENSTKEAMVKSREVQIISAIQEHRKSTYLMEIIRKGLFSLGILVLFFMIMALTKRLFRYLGSKMAEWQLRILGFLHLKEYEFFNRQRQLAVMLVMLRAIKWIIILVLFNVTLLSIFYLLPWTKAFSIGILGFVVDPFKAIMVGFWNYIPNFITIIVILVVARLVIRLFKLFRQEIEKETLKIPGFYPDWALPTFNILRVLIILFTIVAVWPYLPGSGSQVFQGVSVLFGLVFSLTSASSLSNFMAGLTITYTRAFKLGDRVKIGEVTGDIIEKSMLVTKIRTIKNEEITVPNTKIMGSEVINYSTCAPDLGLILHTTVTIGYDAPWRQVHKLLIEAAINTDQILKEPVPFVLQTALNDFYISYQLNAYTRAPNEMAGIFSKLHQNIQDSFNNAGVEIMSPHYKSIRDGNTITIPEDYRAEDYESPPFKIRHDRTVPGEK